MLPYRLPFAAAALALFAVLPAHAGIAAKCKALLAQTDAEMSILTARVIPAEGRLPEHCRVHGMYSPAVNFEVNLPTDWNGKFYMVGNGGYLGEIFDQSYGLKRGYATASTDTGHRGPSPTFALNNREAEIDFAFRAIHLTTQAGKGLAETYYGKAPRFSYYRGCSTGGRQGLMEAQRFPDDFDGMSVGAPIYDYTLKQTWNATWSARALFGNNRAGYVPYEKLEALGRAVYAKCDAIDGLEDGLIDDPRNCPFEPARDLKTCAQGGDSTDCFTAAQAEAIAKVYDGPGGGRYPGHVKGGEWMAPEGPGLSGGWDVYLVGKLKPTAAERQAGAVRRDPYGGDDFLPVQYRNGTTFWKYLALEKDRPDFDAIADLDFDNLPDTSFMASIMNATDTDLSAFSGHGGKIVMWHGWADVGLNPLRTIEYYEGVRETMGAGATDDFLRLFMVPGMYHCAGGPGTDSFDDLSALENWVEKGIKPASMTAYHYQGASYEDAFQGHALDGGFDAVRSRPLCPYPQVAKYKGEGSVDEAGNFVCAAP